MKDFADKLNELKVDSDGVTPMEKFSGTKIDITLKIAIHWSVQFMSWMQY